MVPIATKLGKMAIYLDELLRIKSNDPLSNGFIKSRNKLKSLYIDYHSVSGHESWQDGNLP